ncbi:hypothetical protein CYY_000383 [Polysphondylium violaceum]|uniref:snRNA-activating protein complex subunit 3 n=1 Tax=Polysphondylium violaceum TaxID=133409 RepID=A0A8J4Q1V7_9MYCE|nr:hypothetical protein CYY_000383 [Polysphondylium violaceum]
MSDHGSDNEFDDMFTKPLTSVLSIQTSSYYNISNSKVININQFRTEFLDAISKETDDCIFETTFADLSIDDIRPVTHYEKVENEIKEYKSTKDYTSIQQQEDQEQQRRHLEKQMHKRQQKRLQREQKQRQELQLLHGQPQQTIQPSPEVTSVNANGNNTNTSTTTTTTTTTTKPTRAPKPRKKKKDNPPEEEPQQSQQQQQQQNPIVTTEAQTETPESSSPLTILSITPNTITPETATPTTTTPGTSTPKSARGKKKSTDEPKKPRGRPRKVLPTDALDAFSKNQQDTIPTTASNEDIEIISTLTSISQAGNNSNNSNNNNNNNKNNNNNNSRVNEISIARLTELSNNSPPILPSSIETFPMMMDTTVNMPSIIGQLPLITPMAPLNINILDPSTSPLTNSSSPSTLSPIILPPNFNLSSPLIIPQLLQPQPQSQPQSQSQSQSHPQPQFTLNDDGTITTLPPPPPITIIPTTPMETPIPSTPVNTNTTTTTTTTTTHPAATTLPQTPVNNKKKGKESTRKRGKKNNNDNNNESNNNESNNNNNNNNNTIINVESPPTQQSIVPTELVDPTEVVVQVSIYHPNRDVKSMDILVLGSQKLTELKDKIYCLGDTILNGPSRKSGYFFINNTFYDDTRDDNNLLYSQYVLDWLNQNKRKTSHFNQEKMQDVTFNDLSVSLGEKYLYCHQGSCEHFVVFEQLKLLNGNDDQDKTHYPKIRHQLKHRRRKCKVCEIYPAKYVTLGDKMVDETPYFYCEVCYRHFHYTKEGVLLYNDYKVYPYFHE